MRYNIISQILVVILIFCCFKCGVYGQTKTVANANKSYCEELDLNISTNKEIYFSEDTLLIHVLALRKRDRKQAERKVSLVVTLIAENGEVLTSNRYNVGGGELSDAINLEQSWGTGVFNMAVYTESCIGPQYFVTCQKSIIIIRPDEPVEKLLGKKGFKFLTENKSTKKLELVYGQKVETQIETGKATVPIRAMAANKPIDLKGKIINNFGDSVGSFLTKKSGFGRTTPALDKNTLYHLVVDSGKYLPNKFPLYIYDNQLFDIDLYQSQDKIRITCFKTKPSTEIGKMFLSFEDLEGSVKTMEVHFEEGKSVVNILSRELLEGLINVKLLDGDGRPLVIKQFYNFWPGLDILVNKDSFVLAPEGHVSMDLMIKDEKGQPVEANLLVFVKSADNFTWQHQYPYLSRLTNPLEHFLPGFFPASIGTKDELNNVLDFYSGKFSINTHTPFFTNRVVKNDTVTFYGKLIGGNTKLLIGYSFDEDRWLEIIAVEEGGVFSFKLPAFSGRKKVSFFNSSSLFEPDKKMIDSTFRITEPQSLKPAINFLPYMVNDSVAMFSTLKSKIEAYVLANYFKEDSEFSSLALKDSTTESIYDHRFVLEEYTKMPNMFEVMREIVKGVAVRRTKDDYKVRVFSTDLRENFPRDPVFFVDDQIVFDKDLVLSFNLKEVESIDVINSFKNLSFYGVLGKNGIVRINTQSKTFQVQSGAQLATFYLDGNKEPNNLAIKKEYVSKGTESTNLNLPQTVFWNSQMKTDAQGKLKIDFDLSHEINDFEIVVRAIAKNGNAAERRIPLIVKPSLIK